MAEPKYRLFDMDDYSKEILSPNYTNGDPIGRYIENEAAERCDTILDTCGPVDLPVEQFQIKSKNHSSKQITLTSISSKNLEMLDDEQLELWFEPRISKIHMVPRDDQRGMTGVSFNVRIGDCSEALNRIMMHFLEAAKKAKQKLMFIDDDSNNYPRATASNKGLWMELDRDSGSWKIRCSSTYFTRLQLLSQGEKQFDTLFEVCYIKSNKL